MQILYMISTILAGMGAALAALLAGATPWTAILTYVLAGSLGLSLTAGLMVLGAAWRQDPEPQWPTAAPRPDQQAALAMIRPGRRG